VPGAAEIIATRDIEVGDEITYSYSEVSPACKPRKGKVLTLKTKFFELLQMAERHKKLDFTCVCDACRPGTPFHAASETRRLLARGAMFVTLGADVLEGPEWPAESQLKLDGALLRDVAAKAVPTMDMIVYNLFLMMLLEEEGLMDADVEARFMRNIADVVVTTPRNEDFIKQTIVAMNWRKRFLMTFRLFGRRDRSDRVKWKRFQDCVAATRRKHAAKEKESWLESLD
jgi:hypothetical protein